MEIKVTFRFDASDSLLTCVDNFRKAMEAMSAAGGLSILPANKDAGIVKAVATEEGVTVNKKERIWPPVEETPEEPAAAPVAPASDGDGTEARDAHEAPSEAPETGSSSIPSVSDMRAAVARCRERIEGADWEDKASDGYKQWHKKVTAAVKGIVAFCGSDKIPGIPEENRASFIQKVDELGIDGDKVTSTLPF